MFTWLYNSFLTCKYRTIVLKATNYLVEVREMFLNGRTLSIRKAVVAMHEPEKVNTRLNAFLDKAFCSARCIHE